MSIVMLDSVDHRETLLTRPATDDSAGQNPRLEATEPRWIDADDDGVAVRSYD